MATQKIILSDTALVDFYGPENSHIKTLKAHFSDVKIHARGTEILLDGEDAALQKVISAIDKVIKYLKKYKKLNTEILHQLIFDKKISHKPLIFTNNGTPIKPVTNEQDEFFQAINKYDMLFGLGAAGTGKTYAAVVMAVIALKNKSVKKIILTRPAVESGENLGFLPGDLKEKLDPYLQPLYDALRDLVPTEKLEEWLQNGAIQIAPLAFMRGRTLDHAFVILDEAQNATSQQLKMFLTRMGKGAKFVITGDPKQIDLPKHQTSGLVHALNHLTKIKDIKFVHFTTEGVIRHHLVKDILKTYDGE